MRGIEEVHIHHQKNAPSLHLATSQVTVASHCHPSSELSRIATEQPHSLSVKISDYLNPQS